MGIISSFILPHTYFVELTSSLVSQRGLGRSSRNSSGTSLAPSKRSLRACPSEHDHNARYRCVHYTTQITDVQVSIGQTNYASHAVKPGLGPSSSESRQSLTAALTPTHSRMAIQKCQNTAGEGSTPCRDSSRTGTRGRGYEPWPQNWGIRYRCSVP